MMSFKTCQNTTEAEMILKLKLFIILILDIFNNCNVLPRNLFACNESSPR